MIESGQFKRGTCIQFKGAPMMITAVTFSTPTARGGNTIAKTRLKNLISGQLLNESIRGGEKFEEVELEQHPCSFMFSDGSTWHFIDDVTFEQFGFGEQDLGTDRLYLIDGLEGLRAMLIEGQAVSITLPLSVDLTVVECDPAIKGATAQAQLKGAVCETGLKVQVPSYLESGEKIRVDTRDGRFIERVKS